MNIADDIDPNRIRDTGNFKIIVTGNYITFEFKGQDAFEFKPYVKLIFASNELPMSNDKSEGFYRRMVIIPMLRKFGKKNQGYVTRVSMTYNEANGPTYNQVKKSLGQNAVARVQYNKVSGNFGYIQKGKTSYQFGSNSPQDKNLKLYRIDLAK